MLFETILSLACLTVSVTCPRVVDTSNQAGIYLSDYCPKMEHCPEGSHVMCMHYNPNQIMGPRCRNARNISITPELANKLLDVSNAIRSKIARGEERGKDGQMLPRGYGIFRLKWDSELATFAQVLTNQCVLQHDHCRATKRFPTPGQTAAIVRFSVPDWIPWQNFSNDTEKGFNHAKLLYATAGILKTWYKEKRHVSAHNLTNYPDWSLQPDNLRGKLYLEMVYGPATHMGCGISAFTDYTFYDDNTPLYYNIILIICNFSARPQAGGAVFNTVPPGDIAGLNPCGCPAGSVEDDDCLCHEELKELHQNLNLKEERTCTRGQQCDPTVVLLPIFTMEDAPLDKLVTGNSHSNATIRQNHIISPMDITDSLEIIDNNLSEFKHTFRTKIKIPEDDPNAKSNKKNEWQPSYSKHSAIEIKNRHFGPKQNDLTNHVDKKRNDNKVSRRQLQNHISRSSIFSKTPRFELPGGHVFSTIGNKRDVVPRKDFSEGKQLVDKYLYRKESIVIPVKRDKTINSYKLTDSNEPKSQEAQRNNDEHSVRTLPNPLVHKIDRTDQHKQTQILDPLPIGYGLDTVEERVISDNEYLGNDFNVTHYFNNMHKPEVKSVTEEKDNKLMTLLDTLEQEVKHVELRDDEKQLFDAKIKKIYDKVIGKSVDAVKFTENTAPETGLGFFDIMENHRGQKNHLEMDNNDPMFDDVNVEHIKELQLDKQKDTQPSERREDKIYNIDKQEDNINSINHQKHFMNQPDDINDDYSPSFRKTGNSYLDKTDAKLSPKSKRIQTFVAENKPNIRRNINNIRQRNHNEINAPDSRSNIKHHKYEISKSYSDRRAQRRELLERQSMRKSQEKAKYRNNIDRASRRKNYYSDKEFTNDDPLSIDRRKYYQDKLDAIQRNLKNVRRSSHKKDSSNPRHMRAMLPNAQRSVNQMESLYMPGRARFLHGY